MTAAVGGEVELLSDQVRVRLDSLLNGDDRHFHQDVLVITQNAAKSTLMITSRNGRSG
jgi:hypothetical protein